MPQLLRLDWKTVKEIDSCPLQRELFSPYYYNLRLLVIDELSYKKPYKYLTLVLDLDRTHMVWEGIGRMQTELGTFFDEISDEIARRIEAIAIDR